jgi:broad specificity phosphatase PhoE
MPEKKKFSVPTVLLVEHGSTEFSAPGDEDRIHGTKYDLPLTARGHMEVQPAANKIGKYEVESLEHSPMKRSAETARMISHATGVKPIPKENLRPWDSGFASGMTHGAASNIIEYYVNNPKRAIRDGEPYGDWWEMFSREMLDTLKRAREAGDDGYGAHVRGVHSSEITAAPAIISGDPAGFVDRRLPGPGKISALMFRNKRWDFIPEWDGETE